MTNAQTVPAAVADFAAAVRSELRDLPASEVEELTEGLEADLAEQFLETGKLGSPDAYARELRTSAGLPERSGTGPGKPSPRFQDALRKAGAGFLERVRANPVANAVLEFLLKLRPVWWLLRAWAIFQIITFPFAGNSGFIPRGLAAWTFMLVLVILSVQWGSRPAPARTLARRTLKAINVICATLLLITMPLAVAQALTPAYVPPPQGYGPDYGPGIIVNGSYAEQVFVYDKNGQLLKDLRFYDQNGQPLDMPIPGGLNPSPGQATPSPSPAPPTPVPGASATPSPSPTPSGTAPSSAAPSDTASPTPSGSAPAAPAPDTPAPGPTTGAGP